MQNVENISELNTYNERKRYILKFDFLDDEPDRLIINTDSNLIVNKIENEILGACRQLPHQNILIFVIDDRQSDDVIIRVVGRTSCA